MVIGLTNQERAFLVGDRALVTLNTAHQREWIKLEGTNQTRTGYAIGMQGAIEHPHRIHVGGINLPVFGVEEVQSWSPGKNIVYGHKPNMQTPLISRPQGSNKVRASPLHTMPGLDELKQAVILINNAKEVYGDQLEVTIDGNKLRIRLLVEL